jgi:O-antigen/teichoic acid export membrane protein
LFELGLGPATAQRMASLVAASPGQRNELLWASIFLCLGVGLVVGILLMLIAGPALSSVRGVTPALRLEIAGAVPFLALSLPASTAYGVLSGALQGRERFLILNTVSASANALMSILPLVVAMVAGPSLPSLIAVVLGTRLLSVIALALYCVKAVPLGRPVIPPLALLKSLLRFGGWVTGAGLLTPLLTSLEKFMIGYVAGVSAVSVYMVPFNLVSRIVPLPVSLSSALFPRFASAQGEEADRLEIQAMRTLCALITLVAIFLMVILGIFLNLWIGNQLAAKAAPVAYIVLVGLWFNSFSHISHAKLMGLGRPDLITKISLFQLIPYAMALYAAVYLWGIYGAAGLWSVRMAIESGIFLYVSGQPKRVSRLLVLPGLGMIGAMAIALYFPLYAPLRWMLLGILLVGASAAALRTLVTMRRPSLQALWHACFRSATRFSDRLRHSLSAKK